jgi:hypothetical protein
VPAKIGAATDDWRTNWEWCPLTIGVQPEVGDTIEINRAAFERYLSKLKRWTFSFFVPLAALSRELVEVFGSSHDVKYNLPRDEYAINRYGKMLAGEVSLRITVPNGQIQQCGSMIVLPFIAELDQKEAMNLIPEDLIGRPQQSLQPDWVSEIAENEQKRGEIEKWKKLVSATGRELEQIFEEAVVMLGAKTKPAGTEEEFIFEHMGNAGVVECKGVGKNISLEHLRQADSHVLIFTEAENRDGKGSCSGTRGEISRRASEGRPIPRFSPIMW